MGDLCTGVIGDPCTGVAGNKRSMHRRSRSQETSKAIRGRGRDRPVTRYEYKGIETYMPKNTLFS
eukprot:8946483-Prorocentrum_lima.AAC.1